MTEDKPITKKEVNDAIEKAKASDPNMATVLGLMDLTYNEGVDDCIHEINKFFISDAYQSKAISEILTKLKK